MRGILGVFCFVSAEVLRKGDWVVLGDVVGWVSWFRLYSLRSYTHCTPSAHLSTPITHSPTSSHLTTHELTHANNPHRQTVSRILAVEALPKGIQVGFLPRSDVLFVQGVLVGVWDDYVFFHRFPLPFPSFHPFYLSLPAHTYSGRIRHPRRCP